MTQLTTTEELDALPEDSAVIVEIEDARTGDIRTEAFQKGWHGWDGTRQGDYPESVSAVRVLRPWVAHQEDAVRVRLIYTPEVTE